MAEQWLIGIATGFISGVISGLIVGGLYYWLAGKSLRKEAGELARLNKLMIRFLDKSGGGFVYDDKNVPVAIRFTANQQGTARIEKPQEASIGGRARIIPPEIPAEPDQELDEWLSGTEDNTSVTKTS